MKSNTKAFDDAIRHVTERRGETYGHPIDMFNRAARGQEILRQCKDKEIRHTLEMIWIKMCRLVETPNHLDSVIDIAGYARCICMILDRREKDGDM